MKKGIRTVGVVLFAGISAMLLFGENGNAYIDPSVMTYMIQAIAGIVIAAGAAIGIYFRRAKKKINETLNIDENRNKEVESDDILVKTETEEKKD
jgi:hypothetical protein